MPITPLHIGIPGLVGIPWPKKIDLFSLIVGSIIIDIDFFLYLTTNTSIHGYSHTFLGALLISVILIIIIQFNQKPIHKIKLWLKWTYQSSFSSIVFGAFIGSFSHIFLDSLIYNDIEPFFPFEDNPMIIQNFEFTFTAVYLIAIITTILFLIFFFLMIKNQNN